MRKIGDILLDRGLITKDQLDKALEKQTSSKKYLGQILIEMNVITEDVITDIQASILGLSVISVDSLKIHPKIIQFIPRNIAIKYRLVPIYIEPSNNKNTLCMVTSEEPPSAIISKMSEKLNIPIKLFLTTFSELDSLLVKHYDKEQEIKASEEVKPVITEEKKEISTPIKEEIKHDFKLTLNEEPEEEILSGNLIEDEDDSILAGDLIEDEDDSILGGSLIEDENDSILGGSLMNDKTLEVKIPPLKKEVNVPPLNLKKEKKVEDFKLEEPKPNNDIESLDLFDDSLELNLGSDDLDIEQDITPKKVSENIVLDLFDDITEEPTKDELKNSISSVSVEKEDKISKEIPKETPKDIFKEVPKEILEAAPEVEEKKESKKLNFLEAFKSEDDEDELTLDEIDVDDVEDIEEVEVFDKSEDEVYVNVDLDLGETEVEEISVQEDLKEDNDDFPFVLDDLGDSKDSKKQSIKTKPSLKSPPPLNANKSNKPKKKDSDPQNVDKSGFPSPEIKEFKEVGDDETNPGTTQKISLNEMKATEDWLKNNKDRKIPDLDSIFNSNDVLDPLDNQEIDNFILSKKLEDLPSKLFEFLKSKKVKASQINLFKEFFATLDKNPSNAILLSMLELLLLGEKPNIDLFFDIILKNINNVNPRNK